MGRSLRALRVALPALVVTWLAACASLRQAPVVSHAAPWDERLPTLQQAAHWSLEGRAAATAGQQGWQASLDWRQAGDVSELRLAGPLGVGAALLRLSPSGLSVDGGSPQDDVAGALAARLGFNVPIASLRYWILGVPDPGAPYTVTRNGEDRAQQLAQSGWTIDIPRYMAVAGDWLPALLAVHREDVRVRIVVERWAGAP